MKHVLSFLVVFLIAGISLGSSQKNTKAPNFSLKTQDGKTFELDKQDGKIVVLNFWATWCPPCRAEIPDFISVYKEYQSKKVEIVGVALDEDGWQVVNPFIARMKINYPIVIGDQKLVRAYGNIEAIPTTFIIDKKGNIVDKHIGLMSKKQLLEKIKPYL